MIKTLSGICVMCVFFKSLKEKNVIFYCSLAQAPPQRLDVVFLLDIVVSTVRDNCSLSFVAGKFLRKHAIFEPKQSYINVLYRLVKANPFSNVLRKIRYEKQINKNLEVAGNFVKNIRRNFSRSRVVPMPHVNCDYCKRWGLGNELTCKLGYFKSLNNK